MDKPEEVESEVAQTPPGRYPIDPNQPGIFPLHCHYHLTKTCSTRARVFDLMPFRDLESTDRRGGDYLYPFREYDFDTRRSQETLFI